MKILLIEDTEELADVIKTVLVAQRYTVDIAIDGQIGYSLAESENYDLIILDVMLPKLDGISICRQLRSLGKQTPILMLTGRGTKDEMVAGLDAGADDYLIKPPALEELVARVRALLRRNQFTASPVLEWGDLRLDPNQCEVSYGDYPLHFTPKEYAILELFLRNSQRVYSRTALLEQIWSFDDEIPGEDTVRSHIKRVRQKLKSVGAADLIETLYGIGYRLNQAYSKKTTRQSINPSHSEPKKASVPISQSQTLQLWKQSKPIILERILGIQQTLGKEEYPGEAASQQIVQEAHKLIGSLGAFGLAQGSQTARELEQLAKSGLSSQPTLIEAHHLLNNLVSLIDQAVLPTQQVTHQSALNIASSQDRTVEGQQILVVDDDAAFTDLLVAAATSQGLQIMVAKSLETAHAIIHQVSLDGVILDLNLGGIPDEGLALLTYLSLHKPHIPALVLTANGTLAQRITVTQLHAKGFLQKPKLPREVLEAIIKILHSSKVTAAKILAVDDDPIHLTILQSTLEEWGFQVTILTKPQKFWETLETTNPALVILDLQMPGVDGVQLCKTLRNDLKWGSLPVLFLSAMNDADTVQEVFAAGADDYVTKPIVAPELVARILNRLERVQLLRNQREKDTLTDLPNRKCSLEELHQWVRLANSSNQYFSLIVLRVDHLHQINQQYGYPLGDQVLRRVGKLLQQGLREEDMVARWGGAEFVVGMYGMLRGQAVEWLATLLETLREQKFLDKVGQPFHVTFSAGVAQFPDDGTTLHRLQQSAHTTLVQAENSGGDRIFPANWNPPQQHPIPTLDILLIHPDQTFSAKVLKALETRGYSNQAIVDGAIASTILGGTKPKKHASIILLAGKLAEFDGFSILKQLQREKVTRKSHVILLLNQPDEISMVQASGGVDYILLPCSMNVIMHYLRQTLERL